MVINQIQLANFRNYEKQCLNLKQGINVFYGDNAQGKTNLLEAIFVCAIGKSFRTNKEKEMIGFKGEKANLQVLFEKKDRCGKVSLELGEKKRFLMNDIPLKKTSQLLGNIFVVLFTPDDIAILKEGPIGRRKFLDIMISQLRPNYMHFLSEYNKNMIQRNHYLKQIKFENKPMDMLDIWDERIVRLGRKIYEYRREFITKIANKLNVIHNTITDNREKISISYVSIFERQVDFEKQLRDCRKIDLAKGYTSIGIHKDDFRVEINGNLISSYGSQGQHRTAILSLKIAELEIIHDEVGEYPILLLDDFMSELDEKRRINLLQNMSNNQVIITCTDSSFFKDMNATFFEVQNGLILLK